MSEVSRLPDWWVGRGTGERSGSVTGLDLKDGVQNPTVPDMVGWGRVCRFRVGTTVTRGVQSCPPRPSPHEPSLSPPQLHVRT